MKGWLISMAISFAARQLAKFGRETDWLKVKTDADRRIRDLMPGQFFDDEAAELVSTLIDKVAIVMTRSDYFESIFGDVAAGNYESALSKIKDLVLELCCTNSQCDVHLASALREL